jgi:hypothetical protein
MGRRSYRPEEIIKMIVAKLDRISYSPKWTNA